MPANAAQGTAPVQVGSQTIPIASVMPIEQMPPDRLVATVDGKPVTAGDLRAFLTVMPPQNQQDLLKNRQRLLVSYGMVKRLARLPSRPSWIRTALERATRRLSASGAGPGRHRQASQ